MFALTDQRLDPDPGRGDASTRTGQTDVAELGDAHALLAPLLGSPIAPIAVRHRAALLRPQFHRDRDAGRPDVMEGFLNIRLPPWLRRLITRGDRHRSGGRRHHALRRRARPGKLLILTQVVLSLQLPFAVVPLVMFTADRARWARWSRRAGSCHLRRPDRRGDHGAQREAAVRLRRLTPARRAGRQRRPPCPCLTPTATPRPKTWPSREREAFDLVSTTPPTPPPTRSSSVFRAAGLPVPQALAIRRRPALRPARDLRGRTGTRRCRSPAVRRPRHPDAPRRRRCARTTT